MMIFMAIWAFIPTFSNNFNSNSSGNKPKMVVNLVDLVFIFY